MSEELVFTKLTAAGQIKVGDVLILHTKSGIIKRKAKLVLNPGSAIKGGGEGEEVIYNRKKNHYFITNMVINQESWVREVYIARIKYSVSAYQEGK